MTGKDSVDLIYILARDSIPAQQIQKNTLEAKASTLVGFAGGMLALLLGFKDSMQTLQSLAKLLVAISVCFFLLSIFLASIVGWVRKYRYDPDPNALAENYLNKSERGVK